VVLSAEGDDQAVSFPRDLFDAVVEIFYRVDYPRARLDVTKRPPKIKLTDKTCTVSIVEVAGVLRVSAQTSAERTLLADMEPELREDVHSELARKAVIWTRIGALPVLASSTFGRAEFDALIATIDPTAHGGSVRFDDSISFGPMRRFWHEPAYVTLIRSSRTGEHERVTVYDLDGTLRADATTEQAALVDEVGACARPAVDALLSLRAGFAAEAVAKAATIDRDVLVEALKALTHMRVDVQPIANAIMLATTDPRRYITEHTAQCAEYGIHEPVANLHVIALLQQLPEAFFVYFDWKASMAEVVPQLATMLRAGPNVALDPSLYEPRYAALDRKSGLVAVKEIGRDITGAILVEIKTSADAYAIACISPREYPRLRAFKAKAHLPLVALTKPK
jgi:hypothetical protein